MESLDVFMAQAAVLLLPGIIWARLDVRYAAMGKPSEFDFVLRAFVYGLASYAVTFVIYSLAGSRFAFIDVAEAKDKSIFTQTIGGEILIATAVGFTLGIGWVYASTWKLFTQFLQTIGATKRYGDEDVWDFTFNSPDPSVGFVHVRDFEKGLVYAGRVNAFSESGKLRELTLFDVQLYDFNGVLLDEVPRLYLARKADDIHIEFPSKG